MILTRNVKESIKTALAMTIVFGIALSMDWERPYWGGFAVAMISLSTIGQSLNKGAKRMLGTLLAFVVSLTLIALFSQDRWWFIAGLSVWVGFCTYQFAGTKSYFWFLAGFVCAVICFDAGTDPIHAFDTAVLRVQETGLGILVYSLISVFLWPNRSQDELNSSTCDLMIIQRKLYSSYLLAMTDLSGNNGDLRMQEIQLRNRFNQALAAARTDTYEVRELSAQWQHFQNQSTELMKSLDRWYDSLQEVSELDLYHLLPSLPALTNELEIRFAQIERMLAGDAPECRVQNINLSIDKQAVNALPHFQKAAFTVTRMQLQHIEDQTRRLFDTVCSIKGFGAPPPVPEQAKKNTPWSGLLFDHEQLIAAVNIMLCLWAAYVIWIFFEIPGGTSFVSLIAPIGMVLVTVPQMSVMLIASRLLLAVVFGGMLHIFIMPHLSSFVGLGSMLFVTTFAICYLFSAPRQGITRSISLAMFLATIAVSNEQTYSFLSVADSLVNMAMIIMLFAVMANLPVSVKPEQALQRLMGRFFYSCEYLMANINTHSTKTPGILDSWKIAYHSREITTLPGKLLAWSGSINTGPLSGTSALQVQALTTHLYALTFRLQELLDASDKHQDQMLVQELLTDIHLWCFNIQRVFKNLSHEPAVESAETMRIQLKETISHLEDHMEEAMNEKITGKTISNQDRENLYLLLGSYRGLSEVTIRYAEIAEEINWKRWKEPVF